NRERPDGACSRGYDHGGVHALKARQNLMSIRTHSDLVPLELDVDRPGDSRRPRTRRRGAHRSSRRPSSWSRVTPWITSVSNVVLERPRHCPSSSVMSSTLRVPSHSSQIATADRLSVNAFSLRGT